MDRSTRLKLRGQLREERNNQCEDCSSTDRLEFHHIIPTGLRGRGRGSQNRLYDIQKHPLNYRLLCHTCHRSYHRENLRFYKEVNPI